MFIAEIPETAPASRFSDCFYVSEMIVPTDIDVDLQQLHKFWKLYNILTLLSYIASPLKIHRVPNTIFSQG